MSVIIGIVGPTFDTAGALYARFYAPAIELALRHSPAASILIDGSEVGRCALRDLANQIDRERICVLLPAGAPDCDTFGVRVERCDASAAQVAHRIGVESTMLVTFAPGLAAILAPLAALGGYRGLGQSASVMPLDVVELPAEIERDAARYYHAALVDSIRTRFGEFIAPATPLLFAPRPKAFDEAPADSIESDSASESTVVVRRAVASASDDSFVASDTTPAAADDASEDSFVASDATPAAADDSSTEEATPKPRKRRRDALDQRATPVFAPAPYVSGAFSIDTALVAESCALQAVTLTDLGRAIFDGLANDPDNWPRAYWFRRVWTAVEGIVHMGTARSSARLKEFIENAYNGRVWCPEHAPDAFVWPRKCGLCGARDVNPSNATLFCVPAGREGKHDTIALNVYCVERALRLMHLFAVLGCARPLTLDLEARLLLAHYVERAIDDVTSSACLSNGVTQVLHASPVALRGALSLRPCWNTL